MSSLQPYQDSDLEREVRKQEDRRGGAAIQTWRWFYVVLIGIIVALLSMVVNLGIAGLNYVKIRTTERFISGPGAPAASLPEESLLGFKAQFYSHCYVSEDCRSTEAPSLACRGFLAAILLLCGAVSAICSLCGGHCRVLGS